MITPLAGFACCKNYNVKQNTTSNTTPNLVTTPKQQAFGMMIKPDVDTFNRHLSCSLKNSQNFLIKYFLTDTLEKHFDSVTISNIFEEALIALKHDNKTNPEYKALNITDFIPDFHTKEVPLRLASNNDSLEGVLGDVINGHTKAKLISYQELKKLAETGKNPEAFHDPIKELVKDYARKMLCFNDPLANQVKIKRVDFISSPTSQEEKPRKRVLNAVKGLFVKKPEN